MGAEYGPHPSDQMCVRSGRVGFGGQWYQMVQAKRHIVLNVPSFSYQFLTASVGTAIA